MAKIIFMGSPTFAVPTLKSIVAAGHQVTAVFTKSPQPQSRGMNILKSPVHQLANSLSIPVYTPKSLKSSNIHNLIRNIEADLIVVVAYGLIIPSTILKIKQYGCINVHPSMLPKFRGAAPLQRTIMNGEKHTAVCIIQMDEGIDTGDIILSHEIALSDDITLMELHNQCAEVGGRLAVTAINNIGTLPRIPQPQDNASYANKLSKEEGRISWFETAYLINCKIRAMNPWPGTFFIHKGNYIKILQAKVIDISHNLLPGTITNSCDGTMRIACNGGFLEPMLLQLGSRKVLPANEFIRGYNISDGTVL